MQSTGIYIEHNAKGVPTFAHIDLKKYGEKLKDFFSAEGISVEKSSYNPEFVAKIKESREQIRNGDYKILKTEDLWK